MEKGAKRRITEAQEKMLVKEQQKNLRRTSE